MTPITTDSTAAVASVRRTPPTDNTRTNSGNGARTQADNPARPSVVVNLNASANQNALNGLTYGNPRANRANSAAGASTEAQVQNTGQQRTGAPSPAQGGAQAQRNAQTAGLKSPNEARNTARQDAQRAETDRQNLQLAQVTSTSRQAQASERSA